MPKETTNTFFGEFDLAPVEEVAPIETPPVETPPVTPPVDTPPVDVPLVEKPKEGDADAFTSEFDAVTDLLEAEGSLFIDPEKTYSNDVAGLAEMMRDNAVAQRAKIEAEFKGTPGEGDIPEKVFSDLDPEDGKQAEILYRQHLADTGYTDAEINDKVTDAVTNSTLTKEANIAKRVLSAKEDKAVANAEAAYQKSVEDNNASVKEAVDSIKATIDSTDEISGFKLDEKEKSAFKDYLFKKGGDGKTEAQRANTEERRLRVAYLDFKDYNKADIIIQAKTEVSKAFKKGTSRFSDPNASVKGKSVAEKPDEKEGTINNDILNTWGA